jgi:voltage-gated potassium channel
MGSIRHLVVSIILAMAVFIFGVVGYMAIEHWRILDAIYMTAITLSTVGFREVNPMSQEGQVFTVVLVIMGVGFVLYVTGALVQFMVEGSVATLMGRRRLSRNIKRLKNHYIICGYGRIGRVLWRDLKQSPIEMVVVEQNRDYVETMDDDGVLYVQGDATDEDVLTKSGIEQAAGLVAVLGTDADNVFLVLTARQLNPQLYIVARASDARAAAKLKAAGANKVESPYEMGAVRMAQRILRPTVTSFLDLALAQSSDEIQMEEIPVSPESELVDVMLKDSGIRQRFNLILIAIKKADGEMIFNPSFEARLAGGDTVIAVGGVENLRGLHKALNPHADL